MVFKLGLERWEILIGWEVEPRWKVNEKRNQGEESMRTKDLELSMVWNIQVHHWIDDSRAMHWSNQKKFYNIKISVSFSGPNGLTSVLEEPKTNILKMFPEDSKQAWPRFRSTDGQRISESMVGPCGLAAQKSQAVSFPWGREGPAATLQDVTLPMATDDWAGVSLRLWCLGVLGSFEVGNFHLLCDL